MASQLAIGIQTGLGAPRRLQREAALVNLEKQLRCASSADDTAIFCETMCAVALGLMSSKECQSQLGGLDAAQMLCSLKVADNAFLSDLLCQCQHLLENEEPRVRSAVAECVRELASQQGAIIFEAIGPQVIASIHRSFARDPVLSDAAGAEKAGTQATGGSSAIPTHKISACNGPGASNTRAAAFNAKVLPNAATTQPEDCVTAPIDRLGELSSQNQSEAGAASVSQEQPAGVARINQQPPAAIDSASETYDTQAIRFPAFARQLLEAGYERQVPGHGALRHDSEGWGCLESSFKTLQALIEGCGPPCLPWITPDVHKLILAALLHQSRFVRERGHHVAVALLAASSQSEGAVRDLLPHLAPLLADGLNDSWPHVRYSASIATRALLKAAKHEGLLYDVLPVLLPPMLFNRHSVAEGLRRYSQTTWEAVMGGSGRVAVVQWLPQVINFYSRQARANNHEFREAACACFSELARKIDREAVQPGVPAMLAVVIGSFRDSSWPVREAACEACGDFAAEYPEETRPLLPTLWDLWFDHSAETVASVRKTAAVAVGNAVRSYGDEALAIVIPRTQELLRSVHSQEAESHKYVNTKHSVAARREDAPSVPPAGDNADDAMFGVHTQLQPATFNKASVVSRSIGSVGVRGSGRGGRLFSTSAMSKEPNDCCMDAGFVRQREPWEAADGGVYLTTQLAEVAAATAMPLLMPLLAEAAAADHYAHACHLQETVWKQLPLIAQHLGKRPFKRYLEPFINPLIRCVESMAHLNSRHAAIQASAFFRDWLGPRVFAGRLTPEQQEIMNQCVPTSVIRSVKGCFIADSIKP